LNRLRRSWICCRVLLPATLVVWLSACHRWVPVEQPQASLQQAAAAGGSSTYRVYVNGSETLEGKLTEVRGDSVVIQTSDRTCCSGGGDAESTTVAVEAVERAEVRETKVLATVLLTVGLVAAPFIAFGVALGIACAGDERCLT
jgi:hypothetical protein